MHRRPSARAASVLLAALLCGCSSGSASDPSASSPAPTATSTTVVPVSPDPSLVAFGPLSVAQDRIVTADGRQVLFHGAGVDSWVDYHRNDPEMPTVVPMRAPDWDLMAAHGIDVVRLAVSWSLLEPRPIDEAGHYNGTYLDQVGADVDAAAARGIATIIDLHQDNWGPSLATPEHTDCPAGTEPSLGWDGAPAWATITDGASTCHPPGRPGEAPAVQAAFRHLYADTAGIQGSFAYAWVRIVAEMAQHPGVIGYLPLSSPVQVLPDDEQRAAYSALLGRTIDAIRGAERDNDLDPKLLFVEPMAGGLQPDWAGLGDERVIASLPLTGPVPKGMPRWIGALDSPDAVGRLDGAVVGWSWWRWQAACGDPQHIADPTPVIRELKVRTCPDGHARPNDALLRSVGRSYPRLSPGRVTALETDPAAGTLEVHGTGASADQRLVLWLAEHDGALPSIEAHEGLGEPVVHRVDGGAIVVAAADGGDWSLRSAP